MDVIDRADTEVLSGIQEAIYQSGKNLFKLKPKGLCHYCDDPVEYPKLYCNSDCASDHDKLIKRS